MLVPFLLLCVAVATSQAFWKELTNLVDTVGDVVPDQINPVNLVFFNRCITDLGCFYTGPPFFHALNRPVSLPPTDHPRVRFLLFTPRNPTDEYLIKPSLESLRNSHFNATNPTHFLIHGFMADVDYDDVRFETKDALLRRRACNVILVDWTKHNGFPYAQAAANTRVVGALIAQLVKFFEAEAGLDPRSVHLIGHSLGAHTAGYAGQRIPGLGRITGLDPAGPYFQQAGPEVRLDTSDALFVDVIHTDGAEFILTGLGISAPIGHMDFYPNGGTRQPGCVYSSSQDNVVGAAVNYTTAWVLNACDHSRSSQLFLESVDDASCRFYAKKCDSYSQFQSGSCPDTGMVQMGLHAKMVPGQEPPARYYLRTSGQTPFCMA